MTQPVALLDANVFPTTWLLDILLTLDEHEIVDVVWSERILDETRRAMVERQHRDPDRIDRFLDSIRSMNPTHCIYGWEPRETLLDELPDPDDRHVLAAALVADADYIVTYNLKDFPLEKLSRYSITAIHPDGFPVPHAGLGHTWRAGCDGHGRFQQDQSATHHGRGTGPSQKITAQHVLRQTEEPIFRMI